MLVAERRPSWYAGRKGGHGMPKVYDSQSSACPLNYLINASHAIIVHIEMLMAKAWTHGHGDEYRRPDAPRIVVRSISLIADRAMKSDLNTGIGLSLAVRIFVSPELKLQNQN